MAKDIFYCKVGDLVKDKQTGFEGIITDIDEENAEIHVDVKLNGRHTPVGFTFHQLDIIDKLSPEYTF